MFTVRSIWRVKRFTTGSRNSRTFESRRWRPTRSPCCSQGVLFVHFEKRGENVNSHRTVKFCWVEASRSNSQKTSRPTGKMDIASWQCHRARATQEIIQELQWKLLEHLPYSPDLAPSDFHLSGPLKNHPGGKRFADNEKVETEVRMLRVWGIGKAMGRVYKCWWRICREINVFSRFESHLFYVL
jgi:hypothetical protein